MVISLEKKSKQRSNKKLVIIDNKKEKPLNLISYILQNPATLKLRGFLIKIYCLYYKISIY